ncbi:MAG: ribosome small subunit-dependent GTPase A [Bacillota bacterium]|nr:ribosome small subunit-dependent GTPase A [Bacillota bacterium]
MIGRVVKLVPRMHYVQVGTVLYKCKAKGKMRLDRQKALVGDMVEIEQDPLEDDVAQIKAVCERKNSLRRPEIANIDKLIITFAMEMPAPNLELLDRLLIQAEKRNVRPGICFNKIDLDAKQVIENVKRIYSKTPYDLIFVSAEEPDEGTLATLKSVLDPGVNVFAGPSGVGKSTIINLLNPEAKMETGEVSEKLKRGKHTTRHSELIYLGDEIFLCDTPGFTGYENEDVDPISLQTYMPDILAFSDECKFRDCKHIGEPDCAVRDAVEEGRIAKERYHSYTVFLAEAIESKKKRY